MDKQTALALLTEILELIQQNINTITLHQEQLGNFSLRIGGADEHVIKCINPILVRNKLAMKGENGTIIIYS